MGDAAIVTNKAMNDRTIFVTLRDKVRAAVDALARPMFVKARSSHVEVIARNRPALMCSASSAYAATVGVLSGEAPVIHL